MVTMKIYYCMSLSAVFYADCIYYTFNGYTFNKSTVWQNTLSKTHTKTQLNLGGLCWTTSAQKEKTINFSHF